MVKLMKKLFSPKGKVLSFWWMSLFRWVYILQEGDKVNCKIITLY